MPNSRFKARKNRVTGKEKYSGEGEGFVFGSGGGVSKRFRAAQGFKRP